MRYVLYFLIAFVALFLILTYVTSGLADMLIAATTIAAIGACVAFFIWVFTHA